MSVLHEFTLHQKTRQATFYVYVNTSHVSNLWGCRIITIITY